MHSSQRDKSDFKLSSAGITSRQAKGGGLAMGAGAEGTRTSAWGHLATLGHQGAPPAND